VAYRIGEKFLEWTDEDPPLDKILDDVTLYWLTDTFPRCIYTYRGVRREVDCLPEPVADSILELQHTGIPTDCQRQSCTFPYRTRTIWIILTVLQIVNRSGRPAPRFTSKPTGYSLFRYELMPFPKSWAETAFNIVSFNEHAKGGHFAVRHSHYHSVRT
jgi:microsomal epoxide hydrolase